MSMVAQIFPLAQSANMSSTRGRGHLSGTVFSFNWRYAQTQRGIGVGSAFGTMNEGDANCEEEGLIKLESRRCWISRAKLSRNCWGILFYRGAMVLYASLS